MHRGATLINAAEKAGATLINAAAQDSSTIDGLIEMRLEGATPP